MMKSRSRPHLKPSIELYQELMQEVRSRLLDLRDRIELLRPVQPEDATYHHAYEFELCCLHLRFICELVAIGSLVLHHDVGLGSDLLHRWHAGDALKRLSKVNRLCFPRPIMMTIRNGKKHIETCPDGLTFEQMETMYGKLGDRLHRGTAKSFLKAMTRTYDLGELVEWHNSLGKTLENHIIMILETGRVYVTNLFGGENGTVQVIEAQGGAAMWTGE